MAIRFDWDPRKAKHNQQKHGISFEEASTVFADPLSITIDDPVHSGEEERFVDVRMSRRGRLLVVCYTQRSGLIRLISAREPTYAEQKQYEERE
jgi:uncharacterized DUF497 family protein